LGHYVFYDQITETDKKRGVIEGPIDLKEIPALNLETDTQFYICGPAGFIEKQFNDLLAVGKEPKAVFFEEFGPQQLNLN